MTPAPGQVGVALMRSGVVLLLAFGALAGGAGYWMVVRGPELATAPDNPAVIAARRSAVRGHIRDRDGTILAGSRRNANGEPYRVYGDDAVAPVIGYASARYGTAGLERSYDAQLLGLPGADPAADLLAKFTGERADPADLTLTLSLPLQRAAVRLLGDDRGAVVMLDPRTGEILVLASTPTFDASAIAAPASAEAAFVAVTDDPSAPLLPRATQGRYVPGSVFKIVTAIAALGSGAIEPATTFPEQPAAERTGLLVSGFRVRDGHHPSTGRRALDLVGATEASCNIYYALAGLRTGGGALADWAGRLGFGEPIPFDLPTGTSQMTGGGGPLAGGFADDVELANAAFGQAEVLVTPLQMALVAGTVANDGVLMRPHLVAAIESERGGRRTIEPEAWRTVLPVAKARAIREAMIRAVEGDLGRRFTSGADVPGMLVAGKSGTAELGGSGEPHSWFIGFAPADDPVVAIAVIVERGGRGGERAAPLAGEMLRRYFATVAP